MTTRMVLMMGAAVLAWQAAAGANFQLTWLTFDGGGIQGGTGAPYQLSGTAGQADASGPMVGGAFTLTGGYWPGSLSRLADCDGSLELDLTDYKCMVACMDGPHSAMPTSKECLGFFDFDGDDRVDMFDMAEFMIQFGE